MTGVGGLAGGVERGGQVRSVGGAVPSSGEPSLRVHEDRPGPRVENVPKTPDTEVSVSVFARPLALSLSLSHTHTHTPVCRFPWCQCSPHRQVQATQGLTTDPWNSAELGHGSRKDGRRTWLWGFRL